MATSTSTINNPEFSDANIPRAIVRDNLLPLPVGPEYDYVLSIFKSIMKDETAAKSFAQSLYTVSQLTGIYVVTLLEALDTTDEISLTTAMAFYLNGINSPTTLYGVKNLIIPNFYAGRNVLS